MFADLGSFADEFVDLFNHSSDRTVVVKVDDLSSVLIYPVLTRVDYYCITRDFLMKYKVLLLTFVTTGDFSVVLPEHMHDFNINKNLTLEVIIRNNAKLTIKFVNEQNVKFLPDEPSTIHRNVKLRIENQKI